MKLSFYFLIVVVALSITNANAQNRVESAVKVAALVPATGDNGCKLTTKPCAVINKATDRTITVRVEESFLVNNSLYKKIIVLDKIAPGEKRYVGCAGKVKDGVLEKSTGYKILLAYYDGPAPAAVRSLYSKK